jgi:hypothetical protein
MPASGTPLLPHRSARGYIRTKSSCAMAPSRPAGGNAEPKGSPLVPVQRRGLTDVRIAGYVLARRWLHAERAAEAPFEPRRPSTHLYPLCYLFPALLTTALRRTSESARSKSREAYLTGPSETSMSIYGLMFKLLAPDADAFFHQFFDFERHAVGFRLTNELAVDLEDTHLDEVFD